MAADISVWRVLLLLLCIVICIIAWQSPQLLKAYLDYRKNGNSEN